MAKKVAATGPVEEPWALPDGWRWERLGDVAELIRGVTYAKPQVRSEDDQSALALLRGNNIQSGSLQFDDLTYVDEACVKPHQFIQAEDIVLTMSSGSIALIGKSGWAARDLDRTTFGAFCGVIRSKNISARLLYHFLQTDHYRRLIGDLAKGTNINNLKRDHLIEMGVPVPPADTQVSMVARIDELLAEIDDGEAALVRARDDLATWRKALLKAAVTGELTADWRIANPPTESGGDFLARIIANRRDHWGADPRNAGKRYADAAEPMLGGVPDLPTNWTWTGIEQLTTGGIRNGLSLKEANGPTAVKGLKLDALQPNGIDWSRSRHLPIDLDRAAPYLLRAGDLLISRANGSPEFVGRCTMVDEGRDDTVFPDTAIRYPIVDEPRLRTWARLAWSAPQSRKRMLALAKSTAGILKISQGDIAAVALPLPPLAEIDEIVARVERLTAEADAGADDLAAMKSLPTTLRQSILAAAFRGDLA